jgi:hypothetical protein
MSTANINATDHVKLTHDVKELATSAKILDTMRDITLVVPAVAAVVAAGAAMSGIFVGAAVVSALSLGVLKFIHGARRQKVLGEIQNLQNKGEITTTEVEDITRGVKGLGESLVHH